MDGSFQIFQRCQHEYWAPKKVGFLEGKSPYFRENPGYTAIIVCRSYCVLTFPGTHLKILGISASIRGFQRGKVGARWINLAQVVGRLSPFPFGIRRVFTCLLTCLTSPTSPP